MHRLILLLSLLILLAAIALRKLNADRALKKARVKKISISAGDLARKMLNSLHHEKVNIEFTTRATRVWAGADVIGKKSLKIPTQVAGNLSAHAHGQAALSVGLYLLSLHDPKAMGRRSWALRFGQAFPIFTAIVVALGIFVRLPLGWAMAIMMTSLALAACAQILTVYVERQASELACVVIEKKRILPRLSDEEAVITATRAWSWYRILPGILSRLT